MNAQIDRTPVLSPEDRAYVEEKTRRMVAVATLRKLEAYMKGGGLVIFDTRYAMSARPGGGTTPEGDQLRRMLQTLDIPELEPIPRARVDVAVHNPGGWRATKPAVLRMPDVQRVPPPDSALVSKRRPSTTMNAWPAFA